MSTAPLRLRVVATVAETDDARSVVLTPEGGPVGYRPGQFLTFRVPAAEGSLARCYSLSSSPHAEPDRLVVTVKRIPGGRGSAWMCDELAVGDVVDALRPAGTFTPRELDQDLLLVAAGSGVTPVMSILRSALDAGTGRIAVLYANRDERSVIFAAELAALERAHPDRLVVLHWLESLHGLPDDERLAARLAAYAGREAFVCGPALFMRAVEKALAAAGTDSALVHVEEFVSLTGDPFAAPEPVALAAGEDVDAAELEVTLDGATRTLPWARSRPLTDVLLAAGLPAPYSCREGACSACACVVTEGEVAMEVNQVLDDADLADGLVLGCQARPVSDRVRISYDG
ncbi:ferredoxin--NADP reductase [Pimelobacter simplex]|uniref:ferredoxin--NADP reductase n=1 Tax=Nocardioides simplex TaxID=2045 RepID=UPI00214F797C|nr:ferredoxin--NADP reductase [Pimelobacter simplex]UUW91127.1 ferredoxin--NADP reductase [Pimelobacter simplex]UUW94955.1 ferredoxin--NADP reductase [Pimelobacter simplex]